MEDYSLRCCRPPGLLSMHQREFCTKCYRVRSSDEHLTFSLYVCAYCGEIHRPEEIRIALICTACLPECRLYPIPLHHLSKTHCQDGICCDHCGNPVGHDEQLGVTF